ncbi:MAG TPA: acyltransferase [Polyangiaceae bacterium]|nr:acyltransferase [Polyangiaceae bacterium]
MSSEVEKAPQGWRRVAGALWGEVSGLRPRLQVLEAAAAVVPKRSSGAALARLLSLAGFRVGEGTSVRGLPKITGRVGLFERLSIGTDCVIEADCVFDLEEHITIGNSVTIEPGVMILTSTHELASAAHRAGPVTRSPVVIGDGAWLRARAIILPGVIIGAGAIVDAGAVVNKEVAPHTRVGGLPAAQLEVLSGHGG